MDPPHLQRSELKQRFGQLLAARLQFGGCQRPGPARHLDSVDRILAGNGRSRDLLGVFDPRTGALPSNVGHQPAAGSLGIYGLNPDQEAAFARIVANRPVGLLQGPPGTGKTRFIAALAHYALTKGLARNVLLASQSHEAVNTAAEAVLTLFRNGGVQPSLLRIGRDEEQVSLPLRAYHTPKVEQGFKDRFRASFRDRLAEIASALGLPESAADEIAAIETTIRPLTESLADLTQQEEGDQQRLNSLLDTLRRHLERLDAAALLDGEEAHEWSTLPDEVAQAVMQRHARGAGADRTVSWSSGHADGGWVPTQPLIGPVRWFAVQHGQQTIAVLADLNDLVGFNLFGAHSRNFEIDATGQELCPRIDCSEAVSLCPGGQQNSISLLIGKVSDQDCGF